MLNRYISRNSSAPFKSRFTHSSLLCFIKLNPIKINVLLRNQHLLQSSSTFRQNVKLNPRTIIIPLRMLFVWDDEVNRSVLRALILFVGKPLKPMFAILPTPQCFSVLLLHSCSRKTKNNERKRQNQNFRNRNWKQKKNLHEPIPTKHERNRNFRFCFLTSYSRFKFSSGAVRSWRRNHTREVL